MADENISVIVTDGISPTIGRKLGTISRNATKAAEAVERLKGALSQIQDTGLSRLESSMKHSLSAARELSTVMKEMASNAKDMSVNFRTSNSSSESFAGGLFKLAGVVAAVAVAYKGLKDLIGAADEYTNLSNKLQIVSDSTAQTTQLMDNLLQTANDTRTPIDAVTQSFVRYDMAMRQIGRSQVETLRMQKTINEMLITSGASAEEAASGQLQLSQAFNKGKLDGDEFRSVMELMPSLADAIAKHLGVTRGELMKLAPEGKITAKVMADALAAAADDTDRAFSKTTMTVSQSLAVLKNNAVKAAGQISKSMDLTDELAQSSGGLASIVEQVGNAFEKMGKGQSEVSLTARVMNGALEASLVIFKVLFAAGNDIVFIFKAVGIGIGGVIAQLNALARFDLASVTRIGKMVQDDVAKAFNDTVKLNGLIGNIQIGKTTGAAASTSELRGTGRDLSPPAEPSKAELKAQHAAAKAAETRATSLAKVNQELDNELSRMNMLQPAREAQAKLDQIEEQMTGKKIKLTESEVAAIKAKIDAISAQKDIQAASDAIYENAVGPQRTYNANMEAAQRLLAQGAITQEQYNVAIAKTSEAYLQATQPLLDFNREIEQQRQLLQYLPAQREIEAQIMQKSNELQKQGKQLRQEDADAMREQLKAIQDKNKEMQVESQMYDNTVGKREEFIRQMEALQNLKSNPNFTAGDQASATNDMLKSMGIDTANFQINLDAQAAQFQTYQDQIKQMRDKGLIDEQAYASASAQLYAQAQNDKLQSASTFFGSLTQLSKSKNKELAAVGKAAAISQAMISTYQAANSAYAAMAGIPYVGPALGAAAAAAAVVAGIANVQQIRAQDTGGYKQGGYTGGGGVNEVAGVVHGQEYVMDAQSTARIGVGNLQALQSGAADVQRNAAAAGSGNVGSSAAAAPVVNVPFNAVVVQSKEAALSAIKSTEGQAFIIETIEENGQTVAKIMGLK